MSLNFQPRLPLEPDFAAAAAAADDGEALVVDLDGYEGPLHLLLELARRQKVDLKALSITRLADQFLAFVHAARARRFTLAADYLVMAAWLAYLKSRLLLPQPERAPADEPPAHDLAEQLALRLAKLDAVRRAVEALKARPQLRAEVFQRGDPQAVTVQASAGLEGDLHGLVMAYVGQRRRSGARRYVPARRIEAYPLEAARAHLLALMPELRAWTALDSVVPEPDAGAGAGPGAEPGAESGAEGPSRASYLASTFCAGLEMVKAGALEARQLAAFTPVMVRARRVEAAAS